MTLRSRLVVLTLAILLPVAIFAVALGALLVAGERDTFRSGAEARTLAILTALDVALKSSIATVEALAVSPTLDTDDLDAFRAIAFSVLSTQQDWSTINLALPSGQQVLNLNRPPNAALPAIPSDDSSLARVIETRRPAVGDIVMGPTTKRWDFAVRVPIVRKGAIKYILSAVVNPDSLSEVLAAQGLPRSWVGVVVDRNNRIVARTLDPGESVGQLASQSLRDALAQSASGWFRGSTIEGAAVYTPYRRSETSGWVFAMGIPAQAVEQIGVRTRWTLALGLLTALGLAIALAIIFGRSISGPIGSLAAATKALGQGNPIAIPEDIRVSEVRTLAAALGEAGEAIRERSGLIEREKEAYRAADRTKDEFLAMLSHELRTPLAALTTAAHVLRVARDDNDKARQARGVIERQTKHMARLVEDLLDVSRVAMGKVTLQRETIDLADVVENLIAGWRSAKRLARHQVTHATVPVWIDADRTRIDQIASNLLDNALKFTPPGGKIEITVREQNGEAVLRVADDGEGLVPEAMGRIFDLFAQGLQGLDRSRGGLGIGLALVKHLVEMHGGTVQAASEGAGRGSVFTVRLPAVVRPHQQVDSAVTEKVAEPCRILLIEDNDDTRQMLSAALVLSGHDVREARDGATGLAAAAEVHPDVALIDIGLPDIDGYEVARQLRANLTNKRIPLIALSGYGRPADLKRALDAGFDSHLTKPVAVEQLHNVIMALR
jgi:signal transduction histidine kinase